MQNQQFSIEIQAPREKVWNTLWDDATFRDWASLIDEGTYMAGELQEGNKVQFLSSVNGYGVTSFIEKLTPNEFISFKHLADTKEGGAQTREDEWTGGNDSYSLTEKDGVTRLTLVTDIPPELEEIFNVRQPKALERVKFLADSYPSHWDFSAAGGIDDGEEPKIAALRELKEELGITAKIDFVEERTCTFPAWGMDELKQDRVYLFQALYDGEFSPDPNEVQAVRFFHMNDIAEMMESGEKFHPEFRIFWEEGVISQAATLI